MSILFSPFSVKSTTFRNRVVMPPMVTGKAAADGAVTDAIIEHYGRRADAGTGAVIVEATYVDNGGRCWAHGLGAAEDRHVAGLRRLAERIRGAGAVAAVQLVHGGPQASAEVSGTPTVGPSAVAPSDRAPAPRELTREEILLIEGRFAEAATRAIEAGFDAVEVHGAHGFLLDSFLSTRRNRRTDEYGGPIEARMRMVVEVCEQVRARIGERGLLICRISIFNKRSEGFTRDDFAVVVRGLAQAGIDALHLSTDGVLKPYFGGLRSLGQWVKEFSSLPVIAAGGLGDPTDAERAVAEGHCDLAAVGSAMMENADWTEQARETLS
jgi:2,4-dienoyl-CoA reductase-like NADH-dependent reductase (Old Yellow Enzyme family)